MEQRKTGVIIVAGGSGRRAGGTLPKQFRIVGSLPVLGHAINAFARALPGAPIVVVLTPEWRDLWRDLAARFYIARHTCAAGGAERFHSVRNGLDALPIDVSLVAVHDGARPLASEELIRRCVACAAEHGSAVPTVAAVDSMRLLDDDGTSHPVDRSRLRSVQTPQVFDAALLREAYMSDYRPEFTDDASVFERAGHSVTLCEGERSNLKITVAEDLAIAGALLDPNDSGREQDL
ncbi:MAG: 2-C-methyl-D-erythritol 4-phosphate cytidylyltransferase [Alistipes sp.]|nr:2-C-methyl-D-erythritol 4-phosphate cytidylyltransferase [Alistipes sp.]